MAGGMGSASNTQSALKEEWGDKDKAAGGGLDLLVIEELFSTLAEWNEYLENSVPYYANNPVEGGPK